MLPFVLSRMSLMFTSLVRLCTALLWSRGVGLRVELFGRSLVSSLGLSVSFQWSSHLPVAGEMSSISVSVWFLGNCRPRIA